MSEELEWEMYDLFESGMFAFPIWEHNAARKIVRTLLRRGVLGEEVADAIEESTTDLDIWLNRGGKHMVGEWLIAWMNESREEYEQNCEHTTDASRRSSIDLLVDGNDSISSDAGSYDSDGGNLGVNQTREEIQSVIDFIENNNCENADNNYAAPVATKDSNKENNNPPQVHSQEDVRLITKVPTPPPLPPRTLTLKSPTIEVKCKIEKAPTIILPQAPICHLDEFDEPLLKEKAISKEKSRFCLLIKRKEKPNSEGDDTKEGDQTIKLNGGSLIPKAPLCDPESWNDSDLDAETLSLSGAIYDSIPPIILAHGPFTHNHNQNCAGFLNRNLSPQHLTSPPDCTCSVNHYSLINHSGDNDESIDDQCEVCKLSGNSRAMELNFDTLDRDGPGFIYVMTDSYHKYLPWSGEHRYKVASSRQPEKCLTEFKSRNIEIDLIWQVKVQSHLQAIKEVHSCLQEYNIQSNWYKCPLSVIMDIISKIAKRYRS